MARNGSLIETQLTDLKKEEMALRAQEKWLLDSLAAGAKLSELLVRARGGESEVTIEDLGFVPDHLEFGCRDGFRVLRITLGALQSHMMVRAQY